MAIQSLNKLAEEAMEKGVSLSSLVAQDEADESGIPEAEVRQKMHGMLQAMGEAVRAGISRETLSVSGLTGGEAKLYNARTQGGESLLGPLAGKAATYALASSCVNASMGRIVAAPTAGSCGILPGVLLAMQEGRGYTDDELVSALLCAAGVGQVVSARATLSGAEGGDRKSVV